MGRKTKIVIEYILDNVLEYHYPTLKDGRTMKAADALREEAPVGAWYKGRWPDDPMGDDIDKCVSWSDLLERMRCGGNFYDIIGVGDSVIRERCFEHLAELMIVPYEVICKI